MPTRCRKRLIFQGYQQNICCVPGQVLGRGERVTEFREENKGMSGMIQCCGKGSQPRSGASSHRDCPGSKARAAALPIAGSHRWLRYRVSSVARRRKAAEGGLRFQLSGLPWANPSPSLPLPICETRPPLSSWGYDNHRGQALKCDSAVLCLWFVGKYNKWDKVDPAELFSQAPTEKKEANPKLNMVKFLQVRKAQAVRKALGSLPLPPSQEVFAPSLGWPHSFL